MSVIEEIAAERLRQTEREGWSVEHDDEHGDGSLAAAAAAYAVPQKGRGMRVQTDVQDLETRSAGEHDLREVRRIVPSLWPESWACWHWKPKTRRRDLIRAAALIVAEIERLDRARSPAPQTSAQETK